MCKSMFFYEHQSTNIRRSKLHINGSKLQVYMKSFMRVLKYGLLGARCLGICASVQKNARELVSVHDLAYDKAKLFLKVLGKVCWYGLL